MVPHPWQMASGSGAVLIRPEVACVTRRPSSDS